jgi:hypothetical protein
MRRCAKRRHSEREAAEQHKRHLLEKGDDECPKALRTYWCGYCRAWHVGHSSNIRRPGERRRRIESRRAKAVSDAPKLRSPAVTKAMQAIELECEITPILDEHLPLGWLAWKAKHPNPHPTDHHHVWGRRMREEFKDDHRIWVKAKRVAHEYAEGKKVLVHVPTPEKPKNLESPCHIGELVCVLALERARRLEAKFACDAVGCDVIGAVALKLAGNLYAWCPSLEDEAAKFVIRWKDEIGKYGPRWIQTNCEPEVDT